MDFKKKMKQRLYIAVSYMVLGLILIAADMITGLDNSFFFVFGVALLLMGILRLFHYRKITKDDQSIRKQELVESDELTRLISERAKSWAFSLSITISGIAVIVLSLLGYHDRALPFAWFVCGMVTLYWVCYYIIKQKY